jgi:hypothetical protein
MKTTIQQFNNSTILPILTLILFFGESDLHSQNIYNYQPYPTLLVHGYDATPVGTWGIRTIKFDEAENEFLDNDGGFKTPFAIKGNNNNETTKWK